jgi:hypothetical protein
MKIKAKQVYFNDTHFGKLMPNREKEDTMMLLKTATSYSRLAIHNFLRKMGRLGYKIVKDKKRTFFKYSVSVARIVPYYQRLLVYEQLSDQPTERHKWREVKSKLISDEVIYTDKDLEMMVKFNEPTDTTGIPEINTAEILKRMKDENNK